MSILIKVVSTDLQFLAPNDHLPISGLANSQIRNVLNDNFANSQIRDVLADNFANSQIRDVLNDNFANNTSDVCQKVERV